MLRQFVRNIFIYIYKKLINIYICHLCSPISHILYLMPHLTFKKKYFIFSEFLQVSNTKLDEVMHYYITNPGRGQV